MCKKFWIPDPWIPDRGDIIWINFNPQIGQEMKGWHPLLILSRKSFNDLSQIVIGLPMTTSKSNENNLFAVKYIGPAGKASYVLAHQPKSFDWKRREANPHPWGRASEELMLLVGERLNQLIEIIEIDESRKLQRQLQQDMSSVTDRATLSDLRTDEAAPFHGQEYQKQNLSGCYQGFWDEAKGF
jgi:mRNA interferase MazF